MERLRITAVTMASAAALWQAEPAGAQQPIRIADWQTRVEVTSNAMVPGEWTTAVAVGATPIDAGAVPPAPPPRSRATRGHALTGIASYYWQGTQTASGEPFNTADMTAAHPTLPFGSRVRVTHAKTGQTAIVRINDRGPFKPGRVIDLSVAAADAIGMRHSGLAPVRLEVVGP